MVFALESRGMGKHPIWCRAQSATENYYWKNKDSYAVLSVERRYLVDEEEKVLLLTNLLFQEDS